MKSKEYQIVLHSDEALHGLLPPKEFGQFLFRTSELATQALRMRFEGVSVRPGRRPIWLEHAADIRYRDHESNGNGETRVYYEAPLLRDTTPDTVRQKQMFGEYLPKATDTALDLLADSIVAVRASDVDSPFYDNQLLRDIRGLKRAFGDVFSSAELSGNRIKSKAPAVTDSLTLENAQKLSSSTPKPRQVRVLGKLDMIRHSTNMFGLVVGESEVPCVLDLDDIEELKGYLGRYLLIHGRAIFRPSGRLLRIDVAAFEDGRKQSDVWAQVPKPVKQRLQSRKIVQGQGPKTGVNAFFGKWPGNESDEEFAEIIQEVS